MVGRHAARLQVAGMEGGDRVVRHLLRARHGVVGHARRAGGKREPRGLPHGAVAHRARHHRRRHICDRKKRPIPFPFCMKPVKNLQQKPEIHQQDEICQH